MTAARSLAPVTNDDVKAALRAGLANLERLQDRDGSWPGDYGGPMFLLPKYVALCYASGRLPEPAARAGMIRYFLSTQNEDGSIGLHAEDRRGCMFTSVLCYVALRFLGLPSEHAQVASLRRWIRAHGSPLGAASWGKFTLCVLGLYDWRGIHPVLPELWLLPEMGPFHPGELWCHCRQVYLPMAWLYGRKATMPIDPLIVALRDELYLQPYESIDWPAHRDTLAPNDAYRPMTAALRASNKVLDGIEKASFGPLRRRALDAVFDHIVYEDRVTQGIDIGPVNKVLNAFVHWFRAPAGQQFEESFAGCAQYLWDGHDGLKFQSYESSRLWDTVFALKAIGATAMAGEHTSMVERAYGYVRENQIAEDPPDRERYYRDRTRGAWGFSSAAQRWPVTDCTAEGLEAALALEGRFQPSISEEMKREAIERILWWQNDDGGWASYERSRTGAWVEALNPSGVFGDIMVEYSYVECTSACMQTLAKAQRKFPDLAQRIAPAIARGMQFLRAAQRPDGSFEGAWAVCFTYGTWFGINGLLAGGALTSDKAITRACEFLLARQRADGAWGEHGDSCREHRYVDAPDGSVVQTAWALMALVRARHQSRGAQAKAAEWLLSRQGADGGYAREPMVGVFNRTCLINYDNYRHYFPMWALAEWDAARSA